MEATIHVPYRVGGCGYSEAYHGRVHLRGDSSQVSRIVGGAVVQLLAVVPAMLGPLCLLALHAVTRWCLPVDCGEPVEGRSA